MIDIRSEIMDEIVLHNSFSYRYKYVINSNFNEEQRIDKRNAFSFKTQLPFNKKHFI